MTGTGSEMPTVVMVTTAHQKACGMDVKLLPASSASAKYTALEKRTTPMRRKKMSSPNSLMEAFRVCPNICSPLECLDSLKTRNTLTRRMTRRMAKDMAGWPTPRRLASSVPRATK